MTIKYAILGLLSWKPFSGYDLKKTFENSSEFYWSGNNNQIYKTLVQLLNEGLAVNHVEFQEAYPAKKVYTITDKGLSELKNWVLSMPEPPELRNTFLTQLAWADQLRDDELDSILEKYEYEVRMQLLMHREKSRREGATPARTQREAYLWKMVSENIVMFYENELTWVRRLRKELNENLIS